MQAVQGGCITTKGKNCRTGREGWLRKEQAPEMAGGSAIEALRERMTQIEEVLGEWPRENGTVASWAEHTRGEVQVRRSMLESHDNFFEEKLAEFKAEMQSRIDDFKETLQSYGEDIAILKKAVLQGSASGPEAPSKVRVPKPKGFNGNRNAKELENFLWDIEQFFKATHVPDVEKFPSPTELKRQGVRDLPTAIAAADCLVDYKMGGAISTTQRPMSEGGKKAKIEGKTKESGWKKQNKKPAAGGKPVAKTTKVVQQTTRMTGCFICNSPHRAKDCPKERNSQPCPEVSNAYSCNSECVQVKALVDSGVTHNFVATKEAARLGLKLEEDTSRIKVVNSKAQKIQGIAKNVPMQIGDWKGMCSLLCVPLDDFDLILGVDFLLRAKVALIPHLGGLMVLEEKQPCFMQALRAKDGARANPRCCLLSS
ncbi:hypothetical protein CK203_102219 [Vitis vinifera]|uniref:Retrotransposon gag domain-containing protein n=1 Tax=Vitis vinifera TaxID=29760 RepID=A0A438BTK2_VITVI|nr:hypothetical protein CK203_102219 [Vitis vinifera]